jgi:hypothetical protein
MFLDNFLLVTILFGLALSMFAVINECLTWRSDQVAHLEAAAALRALYQRTFRRKKSLAEPKPRITKH